MFIYNILSINSRASQVMKKIYFQKKNLKFFIANRVWKNLLVITKKWLVITSEYFAHLESI